MTEKLIRCDTCGRFLDFADLCFSEHHFTPLNEFGPEESSFTGPCCRYRAAPVGRNPKGEDPQGLRAQHEHAVGEAEAPKAHPKVQP